MPMVSATNKSDALSISGFEMMELFMMGMVIKIVCPILHNKHNTVFSDN